MILLPSYPHEWAKQSEKGRVGYKPHFERHEVYEEEYEVVDEDEDGDVIMDYQEEEDEVMEEEEDEEDEVEPHSPLTYPNTVPFLHAPRIPHLPSPSPTTSRRELEMDVDRAGPSRRAVSFSERQREPVRAQTISARQSFSIPRPGSGLPPIEYVTSRPFLSEAGIASQQRAANARSDPRSRPRSRSHRTPSDGRTQSRYVHDEPRLLISNNDLTIKVFSLRAVESTGPAIAEQRPSHMPGQSRRLPGQSQAQGRTRMSLPMPIPRLQTPSHDWQTVPFRLEEHSPTSRSAGSGPNLWTDRTDRRLNPASAGFGAENILGATQRLARHRSDFERIVGMRVPPWSPTRVRAPESDPLAGNVSSVRLGEDGQERKLVRLGGTKFKCAINHCTSPSPFSARRT
jgi:hypothetical protein